MKRVFSAAVALIFLAALAGCGKSSSSSNSNAVTISISPGTATVIVNNTQQFTATVTNTTNTAVTWQVNGVTGGTQTVGFVSTSGLYTAPNTVPAPATVNVTAISQADTAVVASATVTVTAPATPTSNLVVAPTTATVSAGTQQPFTATVNGNPIAVNWTLNCQSSAAGACGAITADGVYTAPLSPPPGGNVSVTATAKDNSVPASGAVITVQFGNGTLNGSYAFTLSGQNAGVSYLAAGSLAFDGDGNITGGIEDINNAGVFPVTITSGTYHIGADGRGNASIVTSAGTVSWQFVALSHSRALVMRFDSNVPSASGTMELQDTSQFSAAGFSGAYAFHLSGANAGGKPGSLAVAGAFTSTGANVISSGVQDANNAGVASTSLTINGTYAAPAGNTGRGTMTLTGGFGVQNFAFYIVDATHVKMIELDAAAQLAGDAYQQPAGPFSNASFRGGFAFAFLGSSAGARFGEGGVLTLDGAGKVAGGTIDINNNGNPHNGLTVSGTYSVADAATGRATATLSVGGSTAQFVLYPQANGAATLVEIDANVVAGRALPQSGSFNTGTLVGNYGLVLSGSDFIINPGEQDLVGQVVPNGGSAFAGTLAISDSGAVAPSAALSGSYSVSPTGHGTATLTTPTSVFPTGSFNMYLADTNTIFFLESDGTRLLAGTMQKQF